MPATPQEPEAQTGKAALPPRRSGDLYRPTSDVAEAAARLLRAVGKRVASEDPDALHALRDLETAVADSFREAVRGLRAAGYSDRAIADELGVSRQAVEQRWPRSAE